MKKKIFIVLIILVLGLSSMLLTGCSKNEPEPQYDIQDC